MFFARGIILSFKMGKRCRALKPTLSLPDDSLGGLAADEHIRDWDNRLVRSFRGPEAKRLRTSLGSGVLGYTDYSGMDSPVDACRIAVGAVARSMGLPSLPVDFLRSSDVGVAQRLVLVQRSYKESDGQACVFEDLAGSLVPAASDMIAEMEPEENLTPAAATEAYREMSKYLQAEWRWALPSSKTAFCIVHRRYCPMHPGWVLRLARDGLSLDDIERTIDALDGQLLASLPGSSRDKRPSRVVTPWWKSESILRPPLDDNGVAKRRLLLHVSGLTCTDFCSGGAQKQDAGRSNREHAIWMGDRKARATLDEEDVYFTECAPNYKVQVKQAALHDTHHIMSVLTGPELFGYPAFRLRSYGAGINRLRFVWVGPPPASVQEDFARIFHVPVAMDARMYMTAPWSDVMAFSEGLATSRKIFFKRPPEVEGSLANSLHVLCPASMLSRKGAYERFFVERGASPPWFADLEHNPKFGAPSQSSFLPTILTHPRIYCWPHGLEERGQRFMLPDEMLFSHGFDMVPELCGDRPLSGLSAIFKELSDKSTGLLIGNGMHVPTLSAWILYVLSNIVPVDTFYQLEKLLNIVPVENSDETWEEAG